MGRKEMLKIKRFVIDRFVHGRHAIETFSPRFLLILVSGIVFFLLFQNTFDYFNLRVSRL